MKREILEDIQRRMTRLRDLEAEKSDLSKKVRTEDLKMLIDRLGGRAINLTVSEIKKDIDRDIEFNISKLNEYVGGYCSEVESILRRHMNLLMRHVLGKQLGLWDNLPDEQKTITNHLVEDMVGEIINKLK